jgi:hypothetical protein
MILLLGNQLRHGRGGPPSDRVSVDMRGVQVCGAAIVTPDDVAAVAVRRVAA